MSTRSYNYMLARSLLEDFTYDDILYSIKRSIRTFNGIDTSGAYAVPVAMGISDTLKIQFAYPSGGVARNLNEYIQFDAGDLLQLTSCTATIDGTPIASGASMSAYIDGKLHEIEITATAAISVGYIGQNGAAGAFYAGQILDNIFTISGVTTNYIIDNDSTTTTYARGYLTPSTKYITWSNFTAAYIEQYTYNAPSRRWEGVELLPDPYFTTLCGVNWICDAPEWEIAGGLASCNNFSGTYKNIVDNSIGAVVGSRYKSDIVIDSLASGTFRTFVGGLGFSSIYSEPGFYSKVVTCSFDNTQVRGFNGTVGSISYVSTKHVLEYV